jgi:DNA topoisomerase II
MSAKKSKKSKKSNEDNFKLMNDVEHVMKRPDTYVGSLDKVDTDCWIFKDNSIKLCNIEYVAGLYKIFDEVLVNSIDHATRCYIDPGCTNKVTKIKVTIADNTISVFNDGEGIPVAIHKEHKMYIPEMIFGNLRSSSNYDDDEKKVTGGKNGYGAKLTNIFSTEFTIETFDSIKKKKYIQTFSNNMSKKSKPTITKLTKGKPYTKITFTPDLKQFFKMNKLTPDFISLLKKRVYDASICTDKNVSVYFNDEKITCNSLDKYAKFFSEYMDETVYESIDDRWEIAVGINNISQFGQVSFVNGIQTLKGGEHVNEAAKVIAKKIQSHIKSKGYKRNKKIKVTQQHLKDNMFIILRSTIENPSFNSQIKEFLTTPPKIFGSKFSVSEKFIENLVKKTSLVERALKLGEYRASISITKGSSKKQSTLRGIHKLDDANKAGTKDAMKCTLILTEGDSAKTLAVSGFSVIGRDYFGAYPLKGKILNVRGMKLNDIAKKPGIMELFKIIGLKFGMFGKGTKTIEEKTQILKDKLRYGRIMIFTDQDVDGSHIKGLFMSLIHALFPECFELEDFIISLATPIVKILKGKKVIKEFYTESDYENWMKKTKAKGWKSKYFKGLGTSTTKDAKEYFKDFEDKKIVMNCNDEESNKAIILAFCKEKGSANLRKEWLKGYDRNNVLDQSIKIVSANDFVNKELIAFSNYSCERAIPSIVDGLKPSTRKIIYCLKKKNLKNEIKVAQFAGYVTENSGYHHGESSIVGCIIGLAQGFVGSNNIQLACPNGQFGSRREGGEDAAAPRYIFTKMADITQKIFHPDDNEILEYNYDDGDKIEPVYYVPIIPMLLVNGSKGIATGYSTSIPCYNPEDIVNNLKRMMKDRKIKEMKPWYRHFKGVIDNDSFDEYGNPIYYSRGCWRQLTKTTIEIIELPIGMWTNKYKEFIENSLYDSSSDEKVKKKQFIVSYENNSTEDDIHFTLKFRQDVLKDLIDYGNIETKLHLIDTKNTNKSNMHLYNSDRVIRKYRMIEEIMKEYYLVRIAFYTKRKNHLLKKLRHEYDIYNYKIKFIKEFIDNTIKIINEDDDFIEKQLMDKEYPKFSKNIKEYDSEEVSYEYLLGMAIRTLTKKKMEELQKLCDDRKMAISELESKTEKDLWKNDLSEFMKHYLKIKN